MKFSERLRGSREVLTAGFPSPDPGAGICEHRCCIGGAGAAGGAPPEPQPVRRKSPYDLFGPPVKRMPDSSKLLDFRGRGSYVGFAGY